MTPWRKRLTASEREVAKAIADGVREVHRRTIERNHRMQVEIAANGGNFVKGHGFVVSGLEPDEPIFVLRARDAGALGLMSHYASMIGQGDLFDVNRSTDLHNDIQAFARWRREHAALVRDPD